MTLESFDSFLTGDKYGIDKTKFKGHFASMKSDKGNFHGKVFFENGGYVEICLEVMDEIKNYFIS